MQIIEIVPPREFRVGADQRTTLKDCVHIKISPDEQVTFFTDSGAEYDVVRKDWGFYATPSINQRLSSFGFRTALVMNAQGKLYVMLVEAGKEGSFYDYLQAESQEVVSWLGEEDT